MNAQSNDPANPREDPSSTATPPLERNSDMQDVAALTEGVDVRAASPEMPPPIEPRIGENEDVPPAPDATTRPKKPKAETKAGINTKNSTKNGSKNKSHSKPKRAKESKGAGADKRAAEEPRDAGKGKADEGASILTYLQGAHIESAALPPAATLPPQLYTLFPDMLAVSAVLAVTAAAAGHGVRLDSGKNGGDSSSLALRVAIVGEERHLPPAIAPVLQAAYALEEQDVLRWAEENQKVDLENAVEVTRRRIYRQTLAGAGLLNLKGLSDSSDFVSMVMSSVLPRPRFVLRNPGQNDLQRGLEAAKLGVLLVDERRMPSIAGFGINYDTLTAALLNTAAAGRALELANPHNGGCIRMRPVVASVIGALSVVDVFSLQKATPAALAATMFVPAEDKSKPSPTADAPATLIEILVRVRALAAAAQDLGSLLRLSAAARKTLEQVKTRLTRASIEVLPPLANYYAVATDLVRRIAVGLHVLDHAGGQVDRISVEVGKDAVLRATAFVEQCVLPAARSALAAASVAPEVRNARRIISFIQRYCSAEFPLLKRRDVIRIFQRSMSVAAVDRAIRRLVEDGLLTASNPEATGGGGHVFQVSLVVFDAAYQLADLVTDPRRPRI